MSLEAAAAALTIPGLPGWTGVAALILLALLGLAFLAMPFSVFGVKSRLEAIETQLDEMQATLRTLSARLGDAPPGMLPPADFPTDPPPRAPRRAEPRLDWRGG